MAICFYVNSIICYPLYVFRMIKQDKKQLLVSIVILVAISLIFFFIGRGTKHVNLTDYEQQIKDEQTIIDLVTKEREAVNATIIQLQETNEQLKQKDSIITAQYQNNQATYKLLNDKLQTVTGTVSIISSDNGRVRSAYKDY